MSSRSDEAPSPLSPPPDPGPRARPPRGRSDSPRYGRIHWFTGLAILAVLVVNLGGIWGIAVARRGAVIQANRVFHLETDARARGIETILSGTRADLAFLSGSPVFSNLETALASSDPGEARFRRLWVESTLLLALRSHPELSHLAVRSAAGTTLVEAGRRGGVPVLWRTHSESPATDVSATPGLSISVPLDPVANSNVKTPQLAAWVDSQSLVRGRNNADQGSHECLLEDTEGTIVASEFKGVPASSAGLANTTAHAGTKSEITGDSGMSATSIVMAEGWSDRSPWTLLCRQPVTAGATIDPYVERYRLTLFINLGVMAGALVLGFFALQQSRKRERLEASAREETRVRELERQLFHSERLSTVGRLAAGMAHEINNPLEGIENYLSLATDSAKRGEMDGVREFIDRAHEGVDRAAGVVRQILAQSDPTHAAMTPLDLTEIIRQSMEFVRLRKDFSNIRFDLDLDANRANRANRDDPEPAMVTGNAVLLGQVLLNLLINACEAQPRGGKIQVALGREKEQFVVSVADAGPGIAPEDLSHVFEPFYTTKESTGLGLAVCYSIIQQHQGMLTAENRPGGGAVFELSLPSIRS